MMRRLMLLRHAKTERDAPNGHDQDRRLDERGRNDAADIGAWIARHAPFPDSVLVSSAVRAKETWDIAWEAMKDRVPEPRVQFVRDLYGAEPSGLMKAIRAETIPDNPKRLMVVGHNPGMHELALLLTGSGDKDGRKELADHLPTAGLAIFDFDVEEWSDVAFRHGHLALFVSPKLLRES